VLYAQIRRIIWGLICISPFSSHIGDVSIRLFSAPKENQNMNISLDKWLPKSRARVDLFKFKYLTVETIFYKGSCQFSGCHILLWKSAYSSISTSLTSNFCTTLNKKHKFIFTELLKCVLLNIIWFWYLILLWGQNHRMCRPLQWTHADFAVRDSQNLLRNWGALAVRGVAKIQYCYIHSHLSGRKWKGHDEPWK
jgi:hypothetical protein